MLAPLRAVHGEIRSQVGLQSICRAGAAQSADRGGGRGARYPGRARNIHVVSGKGEGGGEAGGGGEHGERRR